MQEVTSFAEAELTRDAFLDGRLRLWQPRRGYRAATDPVLLAAFTPAWPGQRVLELGCGAGAAALCLAVRVPGLDLHGLELQAAYAGLARRNAAENGLALEVHEGDLRHPPAAPHGISWSIRATGTVPDEWHTYLDPFDGFDAGVPAVAG